MRRPEPDRRDAAPGAPEAAVPSRRERDLAAQLAAVREALGVITWVWDLADRQLRWEGDISGFVGLPPGSFGGTHSDWLACLHPDDRPASSQRLVDCLKGITPSYQAEGRVCWPDGSLRWIETYSCARYGPDGRALQLVGVVRDVTERRRADARRHADEERFRQLIERAPVAIAISRDDRIFYANPAFHALFGASDATAIIGRPVPDLVAPAGRDEYRSRSERRARGEAVEGSYEMPIRRMDGAELSSLVSVNEIDMADGPATLVFLQDISERMRAQLAVRQERDRANNYLRLMESILVALDEDGRITLLNRKGHQTLGYREGELIGRNWYEVCAPPHTRDERFRLFREMMAGRQEIFEYHESKIVTQSGERRVIAWRSSEIVGDDGRRIGTLSAGEDVTERRRAEQALHDLNASLEARVAERTRELELSNAELAVARDAAEAATRAKGNFLANMSHEIRTPMNAILGLTDLARRTPALPVAVQSYLGKVRRAGDSLMVIINDILDFSKIESGKLVLEAGEFALEDVLDKLIALVGMGAGEKGLEFKLTTAAEVPPRLVGDATRLGQILINLCGNAVKFTERGEIAVNVHLLPSGNGSGGVALRFTVRDTGIGMDEVQIARLFQPFDQLDASTTRRFGGTGLGLAICKQLVALMGGEIGVRSEPGKGSEFHFTLEFGLPAAQPWAAGAVPPAKAAPVAALDHAGHALRGRRILLVEDNELNQMVAHDLISGLTGAVVSIAANGQEALACLHAQPFDLVLMDVQMPVMDGYEATRRLRSEPLHAGLPVIAMTAHAMERDRLLCLAAGMNDFISKPFEPRELFAVLSKWLRPAEAGAVSAAAAAAPAPAVAAAEPPPVRFELGLHRCLDRLDLYDDIVRRFLATRGGDGPLMRDALARGDHAAAAMLAHSQVSTAGTVGAEALAEVARKLQLALQAGDAARVPALAAAFDRELGRAVAALRQHLDAAGDRGQSRS